MKNIVIATAAAALALAAAPAFAQTAPANFYGTLGFSRVEDSGLELGAVSARAGARFADYFGVEAEAAFGVDGDTGVDIDRSFAAYAVGFVPVNPQFDLVARVGYGTTRVDALGVKTSEESWNYGVGGQYFFDAANGVRAEYTRYDFENGGGKADVWGVSYVRKF